MPIIRCFRTEDGLQVALARRASRTLSLAAAAGYVEIFGHITYQGGSFVVSRDYSNLGSIGWNDRVSSFKGLNG